MRLVHICIYAYMCEIMSRGFRGLSFGQGGGDETPMLEKERKRKNEQMQEYLTYRKSILLPIDVLCGDDGLQSNLSNVLKSVCKTIGTSFSSSQQESSASPVTWQKEF